MKEKKPTITQEKKLALAFLREQNARFHAFVKTLTSKEVEHHVISAGLGIEDAIKDLGVDSCKPKEPCEECRGNGYLPPLKTPGGKDLLMEECPTCKGKGFKE